MATALQHIAEFSQAHIRLGGDLVHVSSLHVLVDVILTLEDFIVVQRLPVMLRVAHGLLVTLVLVIHVS
jgi:hypothetical protein